MPVQMVTNVFPMQASNNIFTGFKPEAIDIAGNATNFPDYFPVTLKDVIDAGDIGRSTNVFRLYKSYPVGFVGNMLITR